MSQRQNRRIFSILGLVALGAVVAAIGTSVHRYHLDIGGKWIAVGIMLTFAATAVASVFARASAGWLGVSGYAAGWFIVVMVMSLEGPGGDVLIVGDLLGYLWSYGGVLVAVSGFLTPRKWLVDLHDDMPHTYAIDNGSDDPNFP